MEQKERTEQVDRADLVVGILSDLNPDVLTKVEAAIRTLPGDRRVVVLQSGTLAQPAETNGSSPDQPAALSIVPWPTGGTDGAGTRAQTISTAYQHAFSLSRKLGAVACCVIASQAEDHTPQWLSQLVQPVLQSGCDLVVPQYTRGKFQGLLNTS